MQLQVAEDIVGNLASCPAAEPFLDLSESGDSSFETITLVLRQLQSSSYETVGQVRAHKSLGIEPIVCDLTPCPPAPTL